MRGLRFLAALFPALLAAQNSFEITGGYWMPQFNGRVRVEQSGFGTDIDPKRDLGISDTNFAQGGISWRHGRHRLSFLYTPIDYSGDQMASRTILFNGRQYAFGTRVVSDLEVQHLQLSWSWQFIDIRDGLVRLGPVVEANGFLMKGSLVAPNVGMAFAEKEELSAGLPTVGAALDIQPHPRVDLYGQMAGMQAGDYGYFVGSEAGLKVRAWKPLMLTAGYRTFNMHVKSTRDFANLRIGGPFVGAGLRF